MSTESLAKRLIKHEGMKLYPYLCPAGKLTIGVGRNIEDIGISEEEAMIMLENDIERCHDELIRDVPCAYILSLYDNIRMEVLTEMCFNLGITRLKKFKKMIKAIETGDYIGAAKEIRHSQWAAQVGLRAQELAYAMEKGVFDE